MELTQDEVIQILKLIDESSFDELYLETATLKLIVSKGGRAQAQDICPAEVKAPAPPPSEPVEQRAEIERPKVEAKADLMLEDGLVPIKAPMLGILYRSPEPGAPPYVEIGTLVKEDDTVALIEVMKVFNAVKAGVRGYIAEICADSGELVEYGQPLFLVRPADAS